MLLIGAASLAASLLVAAVVTVASLLQTPKYEASVRVLVGEVYPRPPSDCSPHPLKVKYLKPSDTSACGIHPFPIPPPQGLQGLVHKMATTIHSRPVARETIGRLGLKMSPGKLLNNLTVEPGPGTTLIRLTYTDAKPKRAQQIVNTIGQVASERVPTTGGAQASRITAVVWRKASLPFTPVSPKPLRDGLIALVLALMLSMIIVAWREYRRSPR